MSVPPVPSAPGSETGEGGTNESSRADEANWADGATGGVPSAQAVSAAADESHDGAEDPRRKAARLRRRRRLLAWGAAPALLVTAVSLWMGFIFLMTIMANRAIIAEDYSTAVSRYGAVAKVDPVLDTWRVHYNLGTARLLGDDADGAVTELEEALTTAPKADMVEGQLPDGTSAQIRDPKAPECLVRVNLYSAHLTRAQNASDAGDEAGAQAAKDEATTAAGECPVPPPSDDASDDRRLRHRVIRRAIAAAVRPLPLPHPPMPSAASSKIAMTGPMAIAEARAAATAVSGDQLIAEIGRVPPRDRSGFGSRSVHFRS